MSTAPARCECERCVQMAVCVDCDQPIVGTRIYQQELTPVGLIHEEYQLVGPRCETCDERSHGVRPSADAVDPHADSTGTLSTREK